MCRTTRIDDKGDGANAANDTAKFPCLQANPSFRQPDESLSESLRSKRTLLSALWAALQGQRQN
jgi:hypothetical protein